MASFLDIDLLEILPIVILGAIEGANINRQLRNTGQKGGAYLKELLSSTPNRIYDILRMKKESFISLCTWSII
jgi:hypothetical protein